MKFNSADHHRAKKGTSATRRVTARPKHMQVRPPKAPPAAKKVEKI